MGHFVLAEVGGTVRRKPPFFRKPSGQPAEKLAIIGCTLSRKYAPWHDPSWTIVSHCSARQWCQREPDFYMDLHPRACFGQEAKSWNPKYYTWLRTLQTPIFMQEEWKDIPMAIRYPIERVLAEYRAYFTNHVAWMIALAMTEGIKTLGLFGCQYGAATEYAVQRGSCEYWLGRFEQAGGQVILPPKYSDLLNYPSKLYGYESHDPETGKLIPEYKRPLVVDTVKKPDGQIETLLAIDPKIAENRPPLMPPPNGEPIAWERSGLLAHA